LAHPASITIKGPLSSWQHLWYFCAGAIAALAISAINKFPSLSTYQVTLTGWFFNPLYSGWIWALIALGTTCAASGLVLLLLPSGRQFPAETRINWAFGFFLLGWIATMAFFVRVSGEIPTLFLWVALVAILALSALYWVLRYRLDAREELFP
jgi:hypothetical protein